MRKDVRAGLDHNANGVERALKIRGQQFNLYLRIAEAYLANQVREHRGTAIRGVVAIDGCDHSMPKLQIRDSCRYSRRFCQVKFRWLTARDGAKRACAGTDIAKNHEGRRAVRPPTLRDVRAHRVLADCIEPVRLKN